MVMHVSIVKVLMSLETECKDVVQRFLCRDRNRSFIPSLCSIMSGTRKNLSNRNQYLKCMSDKKTPKETAEECSISVTTAFYWRHKILVALKEVTIHNSDISARPPFSFVT